MHKLALTCLIVCAGCISPGTKMNLGKEYYDERMTATRAAADADKAAGRKDGVTASATVTYWMGLKALFSSVPVDSDVMAKEIGGLPTEGVDPELVREGHLIAEKMRAAADSIRLMPAFTILFHRPASRWLEAEALSKAAIEQGYVVERMRPALTARYGVEFPPLNVPRP
jgi:hypothetical protein